MATEVKPIAIIAQDPGKKTGLAIWTEEHGLVQRELSVDEYFTQIEQAVMFFSETHDLHLVSESFIITAQTAKNTQAGWSLELIGVMKFMAHRFKVRPITMQSPSVAKTFANDVKLRTLGYYLPGKGHANDATRHLVTYAAQRKLIFSTDQLKELAAL